jgi:hypothetical protein
MIGKLIKFLIKTVLWVVLISLIIPVGYFALRMGQPMDLPEYKGLTYYQYLEWEHLEHEKRLEEYRSKHTVEYEGNLNPCSIAAFSTGHAGLFFSQGPALILDSIMLKRPFDVFRFLPNWWANFEREHQIVMRSNSNRASACRIPAEIPDEYALSVGVKISEGDVAQ